MPTASARPGSLPRVDPSTRLAGIDLARAVAMLAMLVEHSFQFPSLQPPSPLYAVYGRSAPLFVLLAGVGVSLAARSSSRASIAARAPFLLVLGMMMSRYGDGVILQPFALFFVVGALVAPLSRRALVALSALCLVGGPIVVMTLRHAGALHEFGSRADVGFAALSEPLTFLRGMLFEYYPAVTWLGFFFAGMALGRCDLSSKRFTRDLFLWSTAGAFLAFVVGWAGARAFAPPSYAFGLAPPSPMTWSGQWTTYGFSNAIGWSLSSVAAFAVTGGGAWLAASRPLPAVLRPVVALGAMSLSFYVLHFLYLGTLWPEVQPHVEAPFPSLLASIAFWALFALTAQAWLRRFRRGPFEAVVHVGARALVSPSTLRLFSRPTWRDSTTRAR